MELLCNELQYKIKYKKASYDAFVRFFLDTRKTVWTGRRNTCGVQQQIDGARWLGKFGPCDHMHEHDLNDKLSIWQTFTNLHHNKVNKLKSFYDNDRAFDWV